MKYMYLFFFFFKQKTAYEMRISDWSSDVCSSDLREIARDLLAARGILRLAELRAAGVTAATVSRMEKDGEVIRLARGLYQLPDAELDANHSLAEAAKRFPKGVICLVSALAFHGLTDQLPKKVWMATGRNRSEEHTSELQSLMRISY